MINTFKIEIILVSTKKPNINDVLRSSEGFYDSEYNGIVESIKIKRIRRKTNESKKRICK